MASSSDQDINSDETLNVTERRDDAEDPAEEASDSGNPSPSVEGEAAASPSGGATAGLPTPPSLSPLEAAIRARYDAQLQAAELRTQLERSKVELLEERLKNAELQATLAAERSTGTDSDTAGRSSASSSAEPTTRKGRREREAEWDKLPYVPVENFTGNPFTGPADGARFANPSRPQCFALHHDTVYQKLVESKSSMRYEYEILHPLLYYGWALKEFGEGELLDYIANPLSSAENRVALLEAYTNSYARIFDWLSIRHALIQKRAGASKSDHSHALLEHLTREVYSFVGADPVTSTWLDSLENDFADKMAGATLKSLAQTAAKKKVGASGGESGGQGAGGKRQAAFGKRGGGSLPLSEVGKAVGGSK